LKDLFGEKGGDSSLSLTRKRMRFFTPLTLRSEWQKKKRVRMTVKEN